MKITVARIADLNPCKSRFNNFKTHYPKFSGTLADFVALENITYDDKVWVATRLLSANQSTQWGILCAESTIHFYQKINPDSTVFSSLFAFLKTVEDFTSLTDVEVDAWRRHRSAAIAAWAANAKDVSASAANAAAYAVVNAVNASYVNAAYAAANAAGAINASYSVVPAAYEEQLNLNLLLLCSIETKDV